MNLFASEEQFPELRNPVQIAFDARGRLWVVTMPSFPHTVPGLTPPDKIIILEDTDRDGKADKLTTFAEGLDALDGVAFHRDGVIISEQPRLWMMQDTNGDDVADTKRELLRGIDVTDSHHGGMIATDPYGDVIFSDGVFHRSQLETPYGVIRGIDATTYRLDPITGRINTEWQHTTPNPWNVTFDRWGNTFQVYGDGQVYDGTSLIWTRLGAYHPFRYAHICSYGKGSAVASVSSPNFPDRFKQAIASASLLGRYAVNLTAISYDDGMVKEVDYEAILSSPNAAFRPADVEFGMDGALYVSDFCSPIIGHAQHPMRDPHWDHDFGRIWRIVHTGKPIVKDWPKIEGASVVELCSLLTHPQDLVRHHARIELRKNGEAGLTAVDNWVAGMNQNEQAILEAIFVCEGLGQTRPQLLDRLLQSKSERYRSAAVQVLRLQADRLDKVKEKLAALVNDPHPRVQMEVIDAVAHLRPDFPDLEAVLATIQPKNKHVSDSLAYLDYGIEPAKGRSVPVLDVAKDSQLTTWHYLGVDGENAPVEMQVGRSKLPGTGLFRTFVHSKEAQPAIVAINHKNLEIRVNDVLKFSQNSLWSGDQQVNVELAPGLNVLEVKLGKGRRSGGSMPPVYLYDPVGQAVAGARYPASMETLQAAAVEYDKMIEERGNLLFIQAAAGLQFSPTKLRVAPGSKVRLVFDNPDIMMHNWVLLKPGSLEEVGSLADKLAAQPDGMEKEYLPDTNKILVASKLLGPKAKQELVFTAPAEPGDYPYTCTFPGHWRIMKGVLTVAEPAPAKKLTEAPPAGKSVTKAIGDGVMFETTSSPNGFKTLKPPAKPSGKVVANRTTNNDPIAILTDGKLSRGFGPIFANGIKNGAYRMDLGKTQSVSAITSWSFKQSNSRGAQLVTIYGSAKEKDPGWDFSDRKSYTNLGTISTQGQKIDQYTALSLRSKSGATLGDFRWIAWHVSPVTQLNENTAFQELAVEIVEKKVPVAEEAKSPANQSKPNIILVMTDDQGWAEVGFNGNKVIQTPNLDRFAAESLQLTQFYVSPMCTPTRSSLMTGRYHYRTGAHDTYIGRTNMNPGETTIAEVFAGAGYRTGIFGKWHLGENYPMRAHDQGFHDVVVHGGGGLGQFADYPGNGNYSPTLLYQDTYKKSDGYCTDVFIDESIRFIEENKEKPFFCYVPLNAPHAPFNVDKEYSGRYEGKIEEERRNWTPNIYGMITQLDEAFQRLLDAVKANGLEENTIVIFTTDNGPNSTYFTAGLRARKSSVYENGFRVPFAIRWPAAIEGGRKLNDPTMHIDLLPTLAEACQIPLPDNLQLDGQNILSLLTGEKDKLDERFIFMQHNRGNVPVKYKNGMARKGPWKVVGSKGSPDSFELYNINDDPEEKNDLAAKHPDKVKTYVAEYEKWFDEVTAELMESGGAPHPFELTPAQSYDYRLTWQDWFGEKTGWSSRNYGKWHVNNPGLIERFDLTIRTVRDTHGMSSELKFIWQGKERSKKLQVTPDQILLEDIKLQKGTGWMEAQVVVDGKVWPVQEIQIRPHGVKSVIEFAKANVQPKSSAPKKAPTTTLQDLKSHPLLKDVKGQFVRVELPGDARTLSLAEVMVFEKGVNKALKQKATQSTTAFGGKPEFAIDGNTDGNYHSGSVTHTASERPGPWWEVDLGKEIDVDEIVIANRTDSNGGRLAGFTLKVLNAKRETVFLKTQCPQSKAIQFIKEGVKSSAKIQVKPAAKAGKKPTGSAHLFILAGQSNMVRVDPNVSFAPAVTKAFGKDSIIVIKDAHNGQSIRRWHKGWKSVQGKGTPKSGDLYDQLMAKVKTATEGRDLETITLLWMQGEADAAGNQTKVYKASLDGLLNQLRSDLKRDDIHFVIGRLSDYTLDNNKHPEWPTMRKLQEDYANASPFGAWVNTDDLNNMERNGQPHNDVHYTGDGYRIFGERLAEKAIELIAANQARLFPGEKSNFRGYDRYDRIKTEHGHFSIVCPRKPAPGKPWLWRSLFWEAIKKVSDADLQLVDEGYHVVLAHGDVAGHPKGNANIDAAYELLTKEYGFAKKCSMSSMSRGTLSLFRWASTNPEKVESIYVDNGVCNVLSWPAGKLVPGNNSIATGAPSSWEDFKKKFGYANDQEALKTKESPIDQLDPLAKAGVPILMVCGNKDQAVPYEENDAVMEQRYKALGGDIKVIVENKGHSHGMNDPTPVLEFIRKHTRASLEKGASQQPENAWIIKNAADWALATGDYTNLDFADGLATPTAKEAIYRSKLKTFDKPRSAKSITIDQSPVWHNWEPIKNLGPSNLGDAPVMLNLGPGNYWMFGRYGKPKKDFEAKDVTLDGYDISLKTTPFPNQYNAPGGLKPAKGGYHAWQSKDMVNWVHHGAVTENFSSWVTTAEYADGKLYIYYDYPNDQNPHLYIDDNLTDGLPGKNMGMAFNDPSHGSDCTFIRDLDGNFHVIYEDWSPIDASKHSWDSPLAGHAVSKDGIGDFRILDPAVDERTKPTGKFAEYPHPHWHATLPDKYPGKEAKEDVPQHRIKKGQVRAFAKYEIHEPEQNAYGDWASICIGGQYYLFADYHPANDKIRVGWFTSPGLNEKFTFCGEIGKGHPDPDVMFAEGKFYLATQQATDYVSPGPWVETVEVRVGVDTDNDGEVNQWTDWHEVKESYDYIPGFSKQVAKTPAKLELPDLPEGYGFQFEVRIADTTENPSQPILDAIKLSFDD